MSDEHLTVRRWPGVILTGKVLVALGLLLGVGWASHVITTRTHVPEGVRIFGRVGDQLEAHAAGVRDGRIQAEPDPNRIVRYPLPDELRRAGIGACLERDGALWYLLPSHPLDGGSPYLITPIDRNDGVSNLPTRRDRGGTYHFQMLDSNWAYWFVLP